MKTAPQLLYNKTHWTLITEHPSFMDNEENDYKLKQKKKESYSSKILQGKLRINI